MQLNGKRFYVEKNLKTEQENMKSQFSRMAFSKIACFGQVT